MHDTGIELTVYRTTVEDEACKNLDLALQHKAFWLVDLSEVLTESRADGNLLVKKL